jgi:hypothetical protein
MKRQRLTDLAVLPAAKRQALQPSHLLDRLPNEVWFHLLGQTCNSDTALGVLGVIHFGWTCHPFHHLVDAFVKSKQCKVAEKGKFRVSSSALYQGGITHWPMGTLPYVIGSFMLGKALVVKEKLHILYNGIEARWRLYVVPNPGRAGEDCRMLEMLVDGEIITAKQLRFVFKFLLLWSVTGDHLDGIRHVAEALTRTQKGFGKSRMFDHIELREAHVRLNGPDDTTLPREEDAVEVESPEERAEWVLRVVLHVERDRARALVASIRERRGSYEGLIAYAVEYGSVGALRVLCDELDYTEGYPNAGWHAALFFFLHWALRGQRPLPRVMFACLVAKLDALITGEGRPGHLALRPRSFGFNTPAMEHLQPMEFTLAVLLRVAAKHGNLQAFTQIRTEFEFVTCQVLFFDHNPGRCVCFVIVYIAGRSAKSTSIARLDLH